MNDRRNPAGRSRSGRHQRRNLRGHPHPRRSGPTSVKMERMDAIKLMHRISECLMMTEAMR